MQRSAKVEPGSVLNNIEDAGDAPAKRRSNPVLLLSGVLALAFTVIALLQRHNASSDLEQSPAIPVLFESAPGCSQPAAGAQHHAVALEARALAKNERAPWRAEDGVEAALLLAEARACYELGGDVERAAGLAPILRRWQRKLEMDYQRIRLQLEFTLRQAHDSLADKGSVPPRLAGEINAHVSSLRALLVHRDGAYRSWLEKLSRTYPQPEKRT